MSTRSSFDSQALVQFQKLECGKVPCTTSLQIAQVFDKEHKHVLEKIHDHVAEGDFNGSNFRLVDYKDSKGEKRPLYILDEEFTTFIIMGFTGDKAKEWKKSYIKEFQRMRSIIQREKGDRCAEMNQLLMDVLTEDRELQGKKTKNYHYINKTYQVNKEVFGESGRGKELRQNMTNEQERKLNRVLTNNIRELMGLKKR